MSDYLKRLVTIYTVMFRIGAITFGGGWSIISQVEEEFHEKRGWMQEEQILDNMSLARSFPGIMVINFSVFSGYAMGGIPGAVVAALGLSSPAFIVIALVAVFYQNIRDNAFIERIFGGVRAAVIPIILSAAWKLKSQAIGFPLQWVLVILTFLICTFTGISNSAVIIGGAVIGYLLLYGLERGQKKKDVNRKP